MSAKNKTAVEWLVEQVFGKHTYVWNDVIEKAKAIEKEQIVNAVDGHPIQNRHLDGEQYYTETYGKE